MKGGSVGRGHNCTNFVVGKSEVFLGDEVFLFARRFVKIRTTNDGYQLAFRVRAKCSPELPTDIGLSGDGSVISRVNFEKYLGWCPNFG